MTTTDTDKEFMDGYRDGANLSSPPPGPNRHPAYIHSFTLARSEALGESLPLAKVSRKKAEQIIKDHSQ